MNEALHYAAIGGIGVEIRALRVSPAERRTEHEIRRRRMTRSAARCAGRREEFLGRRRSQDDRGVRTIRTSPSGSAAAVAAGLCYATIDTDAIGSCRLPAACCGAVGFKAPSGAMRTPDRESDQTRSRAPHACESASPTAIIERRRQRCDHRRSPRSVCRADSTAMVCHSGSRWSANRRTRERFFAWRVDTKRHQMERRPSAAVTRVSRNAARRLQPSDQTVREPDRIPPLRGSTSDLPGPPGLPGLTAPSPLIVFACSSWSSSRMRSSARRRSCSAHRFVSIASRKRRI